MVELFRQLLDWVSANPGWAYLVILLTAFAESLAVIGIIVPGVMIMLAAGALIATDDLRFWPACLSAVVGAIAGDGLSYWLGRHYRDHIGTSWPFRRYPGQLDRGIVFFQRYGAMSVIFGRFLGPSRAIIPLVAGILRMHPRRFLIANVFSALVWAPAYLAPGIVFVASLKLAAEAATRLAVLLLMLVGLIWLSAWSVRRLFRLLSSRASSWVQALLHWADLHPNMGRIAQALADPSHPDAATLAALAAALLGATAVLGASISAMLIGPDNLILNRLALDLGQSLRSPLADNLMVILSRLGSPIVLGVLAIVVSGYLSWRQRTRDAYYWLAACGFFLLAMPALALLLRVPRPDLGLNLPWPWSFPSASVLGATLAYGFLAIIFSRDIRNSVRWLSYATAAIIILSIALARVYFGAEWLSDIIGSLALGLAWIAALGLAFRRHARHKEGWHGLMLITVISIGGSLALSSSSQQHADLERYSPHLPTLDITAAQWRDGDCGLFSEHREAPGYSERASFDLSYAGNLETFVKAMATQAWRPADMLAWNNVMKLLSPSLPLSDLPVIPHVQNGRHAAVTLVKNIEQGQRLVLRLWTSYCRIGQHTQVWLGSLGKLRKEDIAGLIALPLTSSDDDAARLIFDKDLAQLSALTINAGEPRLITTTNSGLLPR